MKKFELKTIEDRALEFIRRASLKPFIKFDERIQTLVDKDLEDVTTNINSMTTASFNHPNLRKLQNYLGRDKDLISNDKTTGKTRKRLRSKSKDATRLFENRVINFYKIPQKILGDEDIENESNNFLETAESNNIHPSILKYSPDLIFPINYEIAYNCISELYYPLINILRSFQTLKLYGQNLIEKLDIYFGKINKSNYDHQMNIPQNIFNFNDEEKCYEAIEYGVINMIVQVVLDLKVEIVESLLGQDILSIYKDTLLILEKIFNSLMLKLLFNANLKKENKEYENNNQDVLFEELCFNYVKEYFKNLPELKNNTILEKLDENRLSIHENLLAVIEKINKCFNNLSSEQGASNVSKEFTDLKNCFIQSMKYLKGESINNLNELNPHILNIYNNLKDLIEKSKVKVPYLPPLDKKYIYTLVVDLDETLVHYVEENNRAFVQVRPYADYFLNEMSKYFEIVIFTAAAEEYADIVLKELDKDNSISYKLYRKHTLPLNGIFLKDLSKLGRDIKKVCIIDNNKDNFNLQPDNGLHISSFLGDQNDDELLLLSNDLIKIINSHLEDIRPLIAEIDQTMKCRYMAKNIYL